MLKSTLCYIEKDGKILMLFRNKKENDACEGKYVGIGGKFEPEETPDECMKREVLEETGYRMTDYTFCGIIHFLSDRLPAEDMYLYRGNDFTGEPAECNEGTLYWIPKEEVLSLNLWEGDPYFLKPLLRGETGIEMTCEYEGDRLIQVYDGAPK